MVGQMEVIKRAKKEDRDLQPESADKPVPARRLFGRHGLDSIDEEQSLLHGSSVDK